MTEADALISRIRSVLDAEHYPPYLDVDQAARYMGMSVAWLNIARQRGEGPPFCRIGDRSVRYKRATLDKWMSEREMQP